MVNGARMENRRSFTLPTRFVPAIEFGVLAIAIAVGVGSYFVLSGGERQHLLTPPVMALLLVSNLLPCMALLVLLGRRAAKKRAASIGGGGALHVRLVAMFSLLASVPMLLVTIFASLLFQTGVEFWFSDQARSMLVDARALTQESYRQILSYVRNEVVTMAGDLGPVLREYPTDQLEVQQFFAQQAYYRNLSEAVIFSISPKGELQTQLFYNPTDRDLSTEFDMGRVRALSTSDAITDIKNGRSRSVTRIPGVDNLYLYGGREWDMTKYLALSGRAETMLKSYQAFLGRSGSIQLRFNISLFVISLMIVGLAVWVALVVADRLVRPVGELVQAADRVAGGDLTARVAIPRRMDEIGTLATAFNLMTQRLNEQTSALVKANEQIDSRRALIEAVMSGVSAGVISVGPDRAIRVINASAANLLGVDAAAAVGKPLAAVAAELDATLAGDAREAIVQLQARGEAKTLAVKITRDDGSFILTFDDITQQLLDQRRAAWSDVARRIAHEIKNPLTPIQLAAERLKRRYGRQIENDDGTFAKLTDTIVRQVGDLRRMVDEFSSFARMPKPVFHEESMLDIARQAVFLHEVAHPDITFTLVAEDGLPPVVCDRRQFGQALTNIVKNAVEAVEGRPENSPKGEVCVSLQEIGAGQLQLTVSDNGIGLPVERDRIVEPYMTTRARGTGLGLAIVKKIVEEHFGNISFGDRPGGGTVVTTTLDLNVLAALEGEGAASGYTGPEESQRQAMLTRNGTLRS